MWACTRLCGVVDIEGTYTIQTLFNHPFWATKSHALISFRPVHCLVIIFLRPSSHHGHHVHPPIGTARPHTHPALHPHTPARPHKSSLQHLA
jgi:hypothetical protein